jgi:hypothetical protein
MGRPRAATRPGLSVRDHEFLSTELTALHGGVLELRACIRAAEGSGTPAHMAVGGVVAALKRLNDVLRQELRDQHGEGPALQALYHGDGPP